MLHVNNTDKQQLHDGKGTPPLFFIFSGDRVYIECMNVFIRRKGKKVILFPLEKFFVHLHYSTGPWKRKNDSCFVIRLSTDCS